RDWSSDVCSSDLKIERTISGSKSHDTLYLLTSSRYSRFWRNDSINVLLFNFVVNALSFSVGKNFEARLSASSTTYSATSSKRFNAQMYICLTSSTLFNNAFSKFFTSLSSDKLYA